MSHEIATLTAQLAAIEKERDSFECLYLKTIGDILDVTAERDALAEALRDMLNGWLYIRESHGDLYGVGWDRAQHKAEAALVAIAAKKEPA